MTRIFRLIVKFTDSHVKDNGELEDISEKAKFLIRNRGSCSSSSDSTTVNHEDDANALRQREVARYTRTFSLQEEQMPLAVPREDLDVSMVLSYINFLQLSAVTYYFCLTRIYENQVLSTSSKFVRQDAGKLLSYIFAYASCL